MAEGGGWHNETVDGMKRCRHAGHVYPATKRRCPKCYDRNKSLHQQKAHIKHRYGITLEQYHEMLDAQGGGCAICKGPGKSWRKSEFLVPRLFDVDHDHVTGKVRGLLCNSCNRRLVATLEQLGHLIEPAREYLRKYKD